MFKKNSTETEKLINKILLDLESMPDFIKSISTIGDNLSKLVTRIDLLILSLAMLLFFNVITTFVYRPVMRLEAVEKSAIYELRDKKTEIVNR
jgi:cbb3-type cytochrome oxidase subunit 3